MPLFNLPQHQHNSGFAKYFDKGYPGFRQVEMKKLKSARSSFAPASDQKRPEKKDCINYKQDVSPSRASSAKQRREWIAPTLFPVLLRKPMRAKRPVYIKILIKSFAPVFSGR